MTLAIDVDAHMGRIHLVAKLPPHDGVTMVIGPNGAGKSTLLKCLLGVLRPAAGEIVLGDQALFSVERNIDLPTEERRIGYVPQRYALFTHMTVLRNVAFGVARPRRAERETRAQVLLDDLGIGHLASRKPRALSGGEAQRVALARALSIEPRALLLDEPMAALDVGARRKVRAFLGQRLRTIDVPTVVVSHDVADAEALGGRIVVLDAGRVAQVGDLASLRAAPANAFVEAFVAGQVAAT